MTPSDRSRFGIRLAAVSVLLVGLAFVQDPGFVVADTKLDLVLDPAGFLGRALSLWDGQAALGQLQNQAYGYLFPMGPVFLLGWLVDLQPWVVQRLWQALVLVVAFVGTARVARALGVRSDLACVLAGLAFALSPRVLTVLGPISIEAWPSALAPWVLLFLVRGSTTGSPRRAAAWAGLTVALVGGVNAAATFAVVPVGALWLLTRSRGPRRRSLMLWWPAFTLLGTVWWLVPLFVMGAYSPPFLDHIESASVTTFPTTLFDALRGTSNWVPYVDTASRSGRDLLTTFFLPLNSGVVLLVGVAGLLLRRNPHRLFLGLCLLVGLLMVTAGHLGTPQGLAAGWLHEQLDQALAPLRNVHKFDPVVRLPLVLGLAFAVDAVRAAPLPAAGVGRERFSALLDRGALVAMTAAAVVGAALPAVQGRVEPAGGFLAVPDYWYDAAAFLDEEAGDGAALLVPGSPFGEYVWGQPHDEPMQALARSRWAVRNVVPLTPAGNIRMLDAVEQRLAQGRGSSGLASYLRRAGVRHLVVRNDLSRSSDVPDPVLVHQALATSLGLRRVAAFGPEVGGAAFLTTPEGERVLVSNGWQAPYPAVEVYEVEGAGDAAVATEDEPPVVVGGPEDLLDLLDLGVLGDAPTVLAADAGEEPPAGDVVLTDGLLDRERFFGRVHDGYSAVTTPGDVRRSGNPAEDYDLDDGDRWSTTARLDGAAAVSASSSESDSDAFGGVRPGALPYAALDGSPASAWRSGAFEERATWWRVDLEEAAALREVTLVGGPDAADDQRVVVRTSAGATDDLALGPGDRRVVPLDGEGTTFVRVEDGSRSGTRRLSIAEVRLPGVQVSRPLALPALPGTWDAPDAVVLRSLRDARTGCVQVALDVRCTPGRAREPEEARGLDRVVTLPDAATYTPVLRVRPVAGDRLEDLVQAGQLVEVRASSTSAVPDVRVSPLSAVDGDPGTAWTADLDDDRPSLVLSWVGARVVRGLAVTVDEELPARRPTRLDVAWPGGSATVRLDDDGTADLPRVRTDRLTLTVADAEPLRSLGFDGEVTDVPVGIGEVRVRGLASLPVVPSGLVRRYPCGSGPTLAVDDDSTRTALVASPAQLLRGAAVTARACGEPGPRTIGLATGENRVTVTDAPAAAVESLVLTTEPAAVVGEEAVGLPLAASAPAGRTVEPPPAAAVVGLRENANPGWTATRSGDVLEPVVLDGWQQGWRLTGEGPVRAEFAPDSSYRAGLLGGLVALLALVVVALLTGRRSLAGPAPLHAAAAPRPVLVAVAVTGGALLAGWGGLVVAAVAAALALLLERRAREAAPWLLGGACLVAAAAYALRPWGDAAGWAGDAAWPHYLVLLPVVGVLVLAGDERGGRRLPRSFRRSAGRSTTR